MKKYKYIPVEKFLESDIHPSEIINTKDSGFPVDVFPKEIQMFFHELDTKINYHPDILSISFLSLVSTIIGNKIKLHTKSSWLSSATLWLCIVGDSGTMKSPPMKTIYAPLKDGIDKEFFEQFKKELNDYEINEEKKGKKDSGYERMSRPVPIQNIVSDSTLEGLYYVWDRNKTGICMYREELVGWLLSMNQYRRGSDEQTWLQLNDNASCTVNRATKDPLRIDDPCINVFGHVQPSIVKEFSSDNGMMQRILFSKEITRITPLSRLDVDKTWFDWYDNLVRSMYFNIRNTENVIIKMGADSMNELYNYDESYLTPMMQSENTSQIMKSFLSKMRTFIFRFALVFHVIENVFEQKPFNAETMKKAIRVSQYFIESNTQLLENSSNCKQMEDVLQSKNGGTNKEKALKLLDKGFSCADVAKKLGLSRTIIYKYQKNK
jgi:hypothetical protein